MIREALLVENPDGCSKIPRCKAPHKIKKLKSYEERSGGKKFSYPLFLTSSLLLLRSSRTGILNVNLKHMPGCVPGRQPPTCRGGIP
jgi:hypothetical protein